MKVLRLDSVKGEIAELRCHNPSSSKDQEVATAQGHTVSWGAFSLRLHQLSRGALAPAQELSASLTLFVQPKGFHFLSSNLSF